VAREALERCVRCRGRLAGRSGREERAVEPRLEALEHRDAQRVRQQRQRALGAQAAREDRANLRPHRRWKLAVARLAPLVRRGQPLQRDQHVRSRLALAGLVLDYGVDARQKLRDDLLLQRRRPFHPAIC